jgi:hypothetical protein
MTRAILAVIVCVLLAGCWASDRRLFHDGDWAHLDLDGAYTSEPADGGEQAHVTLKTRPDGLVESTGIGIEDGKPETSLAGFVPIEGGSGHYFLLVERSDPAGEGDVYLIAHLSEAGVLELYEPDCNGTSPTDGLTIERDNFIHATACMFSSKAALMRAGLEAERFLSTPHVVAVAPMVKLVPDDDARKAN